VQRWLHDRPGQRPHLGLLEVLGLPHLHGLAAVWSAHARGTTGNTALLESMDRAIANFRRNDYDDACLITGQFN
jgi:hypothetical protein